MKSSYFTNFILLLLVVGLFWFSQHNASQQNDHSVQLLTSLNPADINTIDIQQRQKNDIKLIRDNASWRLMSPYPAPVKHPFMVSFSPWIPRRLLSLVSIPPR